MVSRASQIVLLCEDKLHEVTVRHFLRRHGAKPGIIRTLPYPKGQGSGAQFVQERYVDELKAFRQRSAQTLLVVVIDADKGSVTDRHSQFAQACRDKSVEPRGNGEAVVHLVPRRHIETWLAYLDGQAVNEEDSFKSSYAFSKRERDAKALVDRFCSGSPLAGKPSSLAMACSEWKERGGNVLG